MDVNSKLSSHELSEPMADSNSNSEKNAKHFIGNPIQSQSQVDVGHAPDQRHPQTPGNSRPLPFAAQENYKTMPARQAPSPAEQAAFQDYDKGDQEPQPPHDPVAYENFVAQVRQLYQLQLAL